MDLASLSKGLESRSSEVNFVNPGDGRYERNST